MKKRLLTIKIIFCCIIIIPLNIHSQTIQGKITDPFTGTGIPNLMVTIGDCTAVTDSTGHYIIALGTPVSVEHNRTKELLPTEFNLFQNYPNPFNSETTILFQISKASNVEVKIYNIYGQEIKSLLNQKIQAGSHKFTWDGSDNFGSSVSSGIYIVYLSAQDFRKSIKTILLK